MKLDSLAEPMEVGCGTFLYKGGKIHRNSGCFQVFLRTTQTGWPPKVCERRGQGPLLMRRSHWMRQSQKT